MYMGVATRGPEGGVGGGAGRSCPPTSLSESNKVLLFMGV